MATRALPSLYNVDRTSGVMQVVKGATHVVPIYQGLIISKATHRMELAGRDMTDYLRNLLNKKGCSFTADVDHLICDVKEKLCFTALDNQQEVGVTFTIHKVEISHELSDQQVIVVRDERF